MIEQTLSVCMIVKNEENNIERCLNSIKHIADEIVIVDTGSTDNTIEICKAYNTKVIKDEWKYDFSYARNKSLENATKDWILFLDADEELPYEEAILLKNTINTQNKFEGFYLRLVNIINNIDIGDAIVFRLFKNRPEYRFVGKMHEQIINSVQDKSGLNSVASTRIRILHYGYDPQIADINKKAHRNIELLLSYDETDKDGYYYYALGNEYTRLSMEKEAFDCFSTCMDKTDLNKEMPIYYPYLMTSIIKLFFGFKKYKNAIEYIQRFKKECKDFKDLYFYECLANVECAKWSEAKYSLELFTRCSQLNYSYPSSTFEKQYDINLLFNQLDNGIVDHEEKLLSAVILAKQDEPTLIDTIKSLNEIVYEVVIVTPNNSNLDKQKLKNYGARIIEATSENNEICYLEAFKKCRGKYIILVEPLEICSLESQKLLVNLLNNSNKDGYILAITDVKTNDIWKSFRILKNNKKLLKFESFPKYIEDNKIVDTDIFIHRYF